jgi:hypothetical protein
VTAVAKTIFFIEPVEVGTFKDVVAALTGTPDQFDQGSVSCF